MHSRDHSIRIGSWTFVPSDIAGRYLLVLAATAIWAFEAIISLALGFNDPASSSPVLVFGQQHPILSIGTITVLVVFGIGALVVYLARPRNSDVGLLQRAATYFVGFAITIFYLLLGLLGSVLLGFAALPRTSPLLLAIQAHPEGSIVIALLLVAITVIAFLLHPRMDTQPPQQNPGSWRISRTWASVAISTTSFVLFVGLLLTVLTRPTWCPQAICPAPEAITDPTGIHDANLDLYPKALQSSVYVIPDDQLLHPTTQLPESVGAVRIDQQQFPPYRVVVGAHSLQQGKYGLLIEAITLEVVDSLQLPDQVNVWTRGAELDYNTNPYQVRYSGERKGAKLTAAYLGLPGGHVQLLPGEGEQLDVRVTSVVPTRLLFKIVITYRVSNESASPTLVLPTLYEVVFSDASHWVEYQYKDGRFVR